MKSLLVIPVALGAMIAPAFCADTNGLATSEQRVSYCIGADIGATFKEQGIDVDVKALAAGVTDAIAGDTALTEEQMKSIMMAFQADMMAKMRTKQEAQGAKNLEAGRAFLEANAKKEGVVVLPSGLQYKVLKSGSGKTPKLTDSVTTHYHGTLIDGTVFDSSVERGEPVSFPVDGVIPGWTEALQLMKEGDKWQLFVPADLAYGERAPGGKIGPNSTLIFEVELLSVE